MTIKSIHQEILSKLTQYIEATYHLSDEQLVVMRREIMNDEGVLYSPPQIETTPRYKLGQGFDELGLSQFAKSVFNALSQQTDDSPQLLFDPPYSHQFQAMDLVLNSGKSIVVSTGTGSGKTETFMLPTIANLLNESDRPSFKDSAMRVLYLYPMNALVNDQLARLRKILGDSRITEPVISRGGRPIRFGQYTSRTPYPGLRKKDRDQRDLRSFGELLNWSESPEQVELVRQLKDRGRWPAKDNLKNWYGRSGAAWQDASGSFLRAVTDPRDAELLTRHEIQGNPPDILVTNYSMLEYMLMRPIEHGIFGSTKKWLDSNPEMKFTLVLDEAHLYKGASGTEVALLIRRLLNRIGIDSSRTQFILTSASFSSEDSAIRFAADLTGQSLENLEFLTGDLEVPSFIEADTPLIKALRENEDPPAVPDDGFRAKLFDEFKTGPIAPLAASFVALTMNRAISIEEIGAAIFPTESKDGQLELAAKLAELLAIAQSKNGDQLISSRLHAFFRGLVGLWVCVNASCTELDNSGESEGYGKLYSQPIAKCACGGLVFELRSCRDCGVAYLRGFIVDDPVDAIPGHIEVAGMQIGEAKAMGWVADAKSNSDLSLLRLPIDFILRKELRDIDKSKREISLDPRSGVVNGSISGNEVEIVVAKIVGNAKIDDRDSRYLFTKCLKCGETSMGGESVAEDHQTSGEEPFISLIGRQLELQTLSKKPTELEPLGGRKVLVFSDSRQKAARIAPRLQQTFSQDSSRALLIWAIEKLHNEYGKKIGFGELVFAFTFACASLDTIPGIEELQDVPEFMKLFRDIREKLETGQVTIARVEQWIGRSHQFANSSSIKLVQSLHSTIRHKFYGIEYLGFGALSPSELVIEDLMEKLTDLDNFADSEDSKIRLVQAWINHRKGTGYKTVEVNELAVDTFQDSLVNPRKYVSTPQFIEALPVLVRPNFVSDWEPVLRETFLQKHSASDSLYMSGSDLIVNLDAQLGYCQICRQTQTLNAVVSICRVCGNDSVLELLADTTDIGFNARKSFYRDPVRAVLETNTAPLAIAAREHTAQLNHKVQNDVFSLSEKYELQFQGIHLPSEKSGSSLRTIDVLSCTTTMEVGIDIGSLTGVALRGFPPARSNYQQRSGRAGRRGNTISVVLTYGDAESHDDYFFSNPQLMVTGNAIDPFLDLQNTQIFQRHLAAFLIQNFLASLFETGVLSRETSNPNLFSVLGTVAEFRNGSSPINFVDFCEWISNSTPAIFQEIMRWAPEKLEINEQKLLILVEDIVKKISAVAGIDSESDFTSSGASPAEDTEMGDNSALIEHLDDDMPVTNLANLLDLLIYRAVLPRYAFPTDVGDLTVFDPGLKRPKAKYVPQRPMSVALSEYAPGRTIYIDNKLWKSEAVYSSFPGEFDKALSEIKDAHFCGNCEFAEIVEPGSLSIDCPRCGDASFAEVMPWLRPPGFATKLSTKNTKTSSRKPISRPSSAKLSVDPPAGSKVITVSERISCVSFSSDLFVSNRGQKNAGFTICRYCGMAHPKIEADSSQNAKPNVEHQRYTDMTSRYKCSDDSPVTVALGTKFVSDIALFHFAFGDDSKIVINGLLHRTIAKTLGQSLVLASARVLEIEPQELGVESRIRKSTTSEFMTGLEIYVYDTLAGGAGYSKKITDNSAEILSTARSILQDCPSKCTDSCYRCLRHFGNRFEHNFLNRLICVDVLDLMIDGVLASNLAPWVEETVDMLVDGLRASLDTMSFSIAKNEVEGRFEVVVTNNESGIHTKASVCNPLDFRTSRTPGGTILIDAFFLKTSIHPFIAELIEF